VIEKLIFLGFYEKKKRNLQEIFRGFLIFFRFVSFAFFRFDPVKNYECALFEMPFPCVKFRGFSNFLPPPYFRFDVPAKNLFKART